jgi:hypothetical protein
VNLLETDLESIQHLLKKLQKKLVTAHDEIADKDSKINSLEEIISVTKIDRRAYDLFSSQNKLLLNKYQSEHKETMNSLEENEKLKYEMKCLTESIELKSQEMISKEIKYEKEYRELQNQYFQIKEQNENNSQQVEILTSQLQTIQTLFTEQMEMKSDEIRRFKQMEYGNLMKSDLKSLEFYNLKDENEVLQETLALSNTQSKTLTQRLQEVMGDHDSVNQMLYQFIQQTEIKNYQQRIFEKKLKKENESLQNEILNLKKGISELFERNEMREKEFQNEKLRNVLERKYSMTCAGKRNQKKLKENSRGAGGAGEHHHNWSFGSLTTGGGSYAGMSIPGIGPERGGSGGSAVETVGESDDILPNIHSSSRPSSTKNGRRKNGTKNESARHPHHNSSKKTSSLLPSQGTVSSSIEQHSYEQSSSTSHEDFNDHLLPPQGVTITGVDLEHSFYESSTSQILERYDHDRSLYTSTSSCCSTSHEDHHHLHHQSQTIGYSAVDTFQYQGKRCLLAKYLRHLVTLMNTLSIPPSLKLTSLDLSRSSLTDADMIQVIDWIRLVSVREISSIDFRYNLLTSQAMSYLATWILSLDQRDLIDRTEPLNLYCQFNLVSPSNPFHSSSQFNLVSSLHSPFSLSQ